MLGIMETIMMAPQKIFEGLLLERLLVVVNLVKKRYVRKEIINLV